MPHKKRIVKNLQENETLFIHNSQYGLLTENSERKAIREENINTYKIKSERKKFILYRLERKKKPVRVKTFFKNKYKNTEQIKNGINSGNIFIREKNTEKVIYRNEKGKITNTTYITQTNYIPKFKKSKKSLQLTGFVSVSDTRRHIADTFYSYSKDMHYISKNTEIKAKSEMIDVALAKFYDIYGHPYKSSDMTAQIQETRYQYIR